MSAIGCDMTVLREDCTHLTLLPLTQKVDFLEYLGVMISMIAKKHRFSKPDFINVSSTIRIDQEGHSK